MHNNAERVRDMDKIHKFKEIIADSSYIVFFGGAGVSTESGIPDFRSEKGLYNAVQKYNHSPEEMLSRTFFDRHRDVFYKYYKENLLYTDAEPNDAHHGLKRLEDTGKLKAVITQNIDGLHQKSGSNEVIELHGSVNRNYCMKCGTYFDVSYVLACEGIPYCDKCGGVIKPDVVLYEESLSSDNIDRAVTHIEHADTLIIGGTSLVVYPAASLIRYFRGKNLVLINKSPTQYDSQADLYINDSIGEVFRQAVLN